MFSRFSPVAYMGWDGFVSEKYAKFISIHTHFESIAKMSVTSLQILPFDVEKLGEIADRDVLRKEIEYKIEPDTETLSNSIARQITRALTYQVILESEAAEHASRMIAMKNASDAAKDLRDDFEFTFNQLRQASITQELAEISAGANAMEQ
jgi:F-type H+-transporting ATPase subunit gamma